MTAGYPGTTLRPAKGPERNKCAICRSRFWFPARGPAGKRPEALNVVHLEGLMELSEADLRFLVETVATKRRDYDRMQQIVRDKPDFQETLLEEPKLVQRLLNDEETFVRISPQLLFSILLRQVRRDLNRDTYTLDWADSNERLPVFDTNEIAGLLEDPRTRDYLVDLLCSFVKAESTVVTWRDRKRFRKRRFSNLDMDDMIQLSKLVEPVLTGRYYKRAADIALFMTGIYPDHMNRFQARARRRLATQRTLTQYEQEGSHFYQLAARAFEDPSLRQSLTTLSESFTLARRAFNALADRYLHTRRESYFRGSETG